MLIFPMYMFALLGVSLLLAAGILQIKLSSASSARNKPASGLTSFNFNFTEQYITPDKSHIIALDEKGKQMAVGFCNPASPEAASPAMFPFEHILGSEIVENALTLTKVSKTSRITTSPARQTPGAAATSGTTAINLDTDHAEEITELTLIIYLDNADTPVLSIPFLPGLTPAKKSDFQYSQALCTARKVHEMIRGIVSA
ncbi:hypothetical protein AMQ84_23345 [Paenibacillus riograndensis]|uniref:Uncharacterized protein n=1 Tax=Paenibacillus riograndensis TaxID=483937 RepID=A0A132TQI9_9BACL|nr:hypothetical protein [Paenibacillus riograndensis]KWX73423.1 hypothetical protein AMQ84_23345 [Paenibacillus riograndensis]KWX86070.1 hypothetical protein AMQ83_21055 [Paenibacillus riograndensis]